MLLAGVVTTVGIASLGLLPVNADGMHSRLEARIMPLALHASITRHATEQSDPLAVDDNNLALGAMNFRATCARCHSTPQGSANVFGESFYPPAPRLTRGATTYTDAQLFWLVKHGIRNTGMPAFGNILSDEQIWQVVTLLNYSGELPASVEGWNERLHRTGSGSDPADR